MNAWLRLLVGAGIVLGVVLTGLGIFARVWPPLDLFNNGFLAMLAGAVSLLGLALVLREWRLIVPAALLVAVNVLLLLAGLQGAAPAAASGSERFLRVATFNLLYRNDRIDGAAEFLTEANADVVVLQEATRPHLLELRERLKAVYPYGVGEFGLVILSKHPIKADGRVDRPGYPEWIRLLARWVEIEVKGTPIEVVGAHVARPFYPALQHQDIATLTQFMENRKLPLVVAGDFNMTPWTDQLQRFTQATRLGRYNTFIFSWPMRWRKYGFVPLFAIYHVFASKAFAKIGAWGGPRLGSDHRAVIADIALTEPTRE
jgi:endonuclease/exonuclease/phosphatase (EEP) superfamily protein YafD